MNWRFAGFENQYVLIGGTAAEIRNLGEYEGDHNIIEVLVADLIVATKHVAEALIQTGRNQLIQPFKVIG